MDWLSIGVSQGDKSAQSLVRHAELSPARVMVRMSQLTFSANCCTFWRWCCRAVLAFVSTRTAWARARIQKECACAARYASVHQLLPPGSIRLRVRAVGVGGRFPMIRSTFLRSRGRSSRRKQASLLFSVRRRRRRNPTYFLNLGGRAQRHIRVVSDI
jgi:hypothetical protein